MKSGEILIEKMNGDKEPYNPEKVRKSMENAGAGAETVERILQKVDKILYNGITTRKLFKFIHHELDKAESGASGLRYNMKTAIMELKVNGGFVFEKFVGRLMKERGYKIKMNQIVQGENVTHEIDVSASKDSENIMIEVKHHDRWQTEESIQTPLYVYARFLEVKKTYTSPMIVTNTRFSSQSIDYSEGVGIKLMGWRYPHDDSLEVNITKYKLYPITILKLSREEILRFLEKNIITVKELAKQKDLSEDVRRQIDSVLKSK